MMEKCTSQKSTHSCVFEAYSHSCNRKPLRNPEGLMVGMTGFEPAKSLAPKASAIPNFATSRYSVFSVFRCRQDTIQSLSFLTSRKTNNSHVTRGSKTIGKNNGCCPKPDTLPIAACFIIYSIPHAARVVKIHPCSTIIQSCLTNLQL